MDLSLFELPFMERALVAGAAVGLLCSVLGVFVVLKGLAFMGDGIAHAAFAGIALGLLVGVPPLGAALVFCALFALVVGYFSKIGRVREDTTIGIFFSASMALAVVLLSVLRKNSADIMVYLFGSILTVSRVELTQALTIVAVVLIILGALYKEFFAIVFDEEFAGRSGIPARALSYLLLVLMAVSVVTAVRLAGVVLVSSLIVAPAATALQLSRSFFRVVLLSAVCGVSATIGGILLSYHLDTPPGATVVLVLTLLFLTATLARSIKTSF